MKIGILSLGLDGLTYMKSVARELPEYDLELYADTRQITSDISKVMGMVEEGVKELIRRQARLIVVLEVSHQISSEKFPNVEIVNLATPSDLKNYLVNNPEREKSLSRNHTRNITLTENTPETDEAVATILGGTLIRE